MSDITSSYPVNTDLGALNNPIGISDKDVQVKAKGRIGRPPGRTSMELMGAGPRIQFTVEKKIKFIRYFRRLWPNVTLAAAKAGVTRKCVYNHMEADPVFCEKVQEIIDAHVDQTEATVVKFSKKPKNFMDRMAVLRRNRPEEWDPARKLIVKHERGALTPDRARERLDMVAGAIDAEVVQAQYPPEDVPQIGGPE